MSLCKATIRSASKPFRYSLQPFVSTRKMTQSHPVQSPRHFMSISDLSRQELVTLVKRAAIAKSDIKAGKIPAALEGTLAGKTVALMFSKRSTRTRVSTEAAVVAMGGHPMFLGKDDIQLGVSYTFWGAGRQRELAERKKKNPVTHLCAQVNESTYDTSKVISSMTSCMVARVGPHSDILDLAAASSVPVINALSDLYHPLQAVTDILTLTETFPVIEGIKVAWVGDANNVLYDLLMACSKLGVHVSIATPREYPVDPAMLKAAQDVAKETGTVISVSNDPLIAVKDANVIVTDTWISMGQESEKTLKLKQFKGFQVSMEMAEKGGAHKDWKFMHCLPRKPEEVTEEVFYSSRSLVFPEAENRLYAALAALEAFVVNKGKFVKE